MKKLSAFLLAALFVITAILFTSCKTLTSYQVFSEAMEKTESLDSAEYTVKTKIKTKIGEMEITMPINYSVKTSGLKSESPVFSGSMSMDLGFSKVEASIYNSGKYAYVSTSGMKIKMDISSDEGKNFDFSSIQEEFMANLSEDVLKDVVFVQNDDGSKTMDIELTAEQFNQFFKEAYDSVYDQLIGDEESDVKADIKLENTKLSIVINGDGYISKYALSYDMTVNVVADGEESSVFASVTSEIEFINPGQPVEVTPPSDIDKYVSLEEATESFY